MKTINMGYFILISLACLISTSCKKEKYAYSEGLKNYMAEEHDVDIANQKDNIYYILPLSDCNTCQGTLLNLELLSSFEGRNEKLTILLVGQTTKSTYQDMIKILSQKFDLLHDTENTIYSYQTGLGKPMLLHIKKGRVEHHIKITDFEIEQAGKYINSIS